MRLLVKLKPNGKTVIDVNYQYHLASMIYRCIQRADESLSLELHKPNTFKFWTFSKLMVPERKFKILREKMIIESEEVYFYFSTARDIIGARFIEGLLMKPKVKICNASFTVYEIKVLKEDKIGRRVRFVTLSPISVTTVRYGKTYDLYPNDPKFYENLRRNLIRKYITLYGREPSNRDITVKPLKVKPKRIRIKNAYHRCVEMVFDAEGSRELLEIGYKAGFGERNSMGFGMVKTLK